jgi:hypothetical protein
VSAAGKDDVLMSKSGYFRETETRLDRHQQQSMISAAYPGAFICGLLESAAKLHQPDDYENGNHLGIIPRPNCAHGWIHLAHPYQG